MTTGWWFGATPYAGQLNYLDYVTPPTHAVTSPTITPEGVVRDESGAGASAGPPSPAGAGLTVGQAAQANAQGGLVGKGDMANINLAMTMVGVPTVATALFSATNTLSGHLAGMNIDPTTGQPVGSKSFQGLVADPMFNQFIDMNAVALSPFADATIGPISANQEGFSISPFSTGTPFSSNPPGRSQTNFGQNTARGDQSDPTEGNPSGVTAGNVSATAGISGMSDAPGNSGVGDASGAGDGGGPSGDGGSGSAGAYRRGGVVPNAHKGAGDDEPIRAQGGEYVVNRAAAKKHGKLLAAINGGASPKDIARLAGKLARRMAA